MCKSKSCRFKRLEEGKGGWIGAFVWSLGDFGSRAARPLAQSVIGGGVKQGPFSLLGVFDVGFED